MVLVGAAVGAAVKFFGSRRDDGDDDVQGDHPVVEAMFRAVNKGDTDDLQGVIDEKCRFYVDDLALSDGDLDGGPELLTKTLSELRTSLPDVHWELYDELSGKDEGKSKLAIRFVSRSTIDGDAVAFSVAGFGILEDDLLVEWRQVADMTEYNRHRAALGRAPVDDT